MKIRHKPHTAQATFAYMIVSVIFALMITGTVYYLTTFYKINRIDKDMQELRQITNQIDYNVRTYLM